MRKIVVILLFVLFFGFLSSPAKGDDMFAECDQCGYCVPSTNNSPTTLPGNWQECAKCLYPQIYPTDSTPDHTGKDSLRIDLTIGPTNGYNPPTPQVGRAYTMLGCVKTDLTGGFRSDGAAASVVQVLMDLLFKISGALAFLYLIYGSFLIITSQADPEKLNYGKKVFFGAIVGLIFASSSVFLLNLLASGILKIPGFGS